VRGKETAQAAGISRAQKAKALRRLPEIYRGAVSKKCLSFLRRQRAVHVFHNHFGLGATFWKALFFIVHPAVFRAQQ
jgi:hypothetical protein